MKWEEQIKRWKQNPQLPISPYLAYVYPCCKPGIGSSGLVASPSRVSPLLMLSSENRLRMLRKLACFKMRKYVHMVAFFWHHLLGAMSRKLAIFERGNTFTWYNFSLPLWEWFFYYGNLDE